MTLSIDPRRVVERAMANSALEAVTARAPGSEPDAPVLTDDQRAALTFLAFPAISTAAIGLEGWVSSAETDPLSGLRKITFHDMASGAPVNGLMLVDLFEQAAAHILVATATPALYDVYMKMANASLHLIKQMLGSPRHAPVFTVRPVHY